MSILLLCVVLMTTTLVPVNPISCSVCYGPHICDNVYIPATRCNNPEQQFCINDVENNGDGSRIVTKRCATKAECYKDWIIQSAYRLECARYDVRNTIPVNFKCSFCCQGDNCNMATVPTVLAFG